MCGFQKHSPYINTNFDLIEVNCNTEKMQNKYYARWIKKYKDFFSISKENEQIALSCRMRRSKKEMFASSQAIAEAKVARKNSCIVSYYYLCYYSILHAMQSVLYLNTDIGENIVGLSHAQIRKYFVDYYAKGINSIVDNNIDSLLVECRYLREYYSYNTPFNTISSKIKEKELIKIIKQCMQLTNFHSLLIEKAGNPIKTTNNNIYDKYELFKYYNAKKSPSGQYEYDVADEYVLDEMLRYACSYSCFSLELEHDFDEYGYYGLGTNLFLNKDAYCNLKGESWEFIYKTLCYGE